MKDSGAAIDALIPKDLQPLVFWFLVTFSRFEYAIKRAGYITPRAEPDWDRFARVHRNDFADDKTRAVKAACEYFERCPPRKQVRHGTVLSWSAPSFRGKQAQLQWLLLMVRRVRNNLFHGGKYPVAHDPDPERDPALLNHALIILHAALRLDDSVFSHFKAP